MTRRPGIRWGAVVASAFTSEALMLVLAIVFRQRQYGEQAVTDMALILGVSLVGPSPQIPLSYYVAHGLKLVGGALGGAIAARRAAAPLTMGSEVI